MDIYVGSIPFKWKEKNLEELFGEYGKVSSAKIIIDKITRQSKGFGFVTMDNEEEALLAISRLNGSEHEERSIVVTPSVPKIDVKKPQRSTASSRDRKKPMEFKSEKHKNSVPPWMRKEY